MRLAAGRFSRSLDPKSSSIAKLWQIAASGSTRVDSALSSSGSPLNRKQRGSTPASMSLNAATVSDSSSAQETLGPVTITPELAPLGAGLAISVSWARLSRPPRWAVSMASAGSVCPRVVAPGLLPSVPNLVGRLEGERKSAGARPAQLSETNFAGRSARSTGSQSTMRMGLLPLASKSSSQAGNATCVQTTHRAH